ncbi:hypothetical protein P7C71_g675, partial [Lecanoromycetidae sp. Uapishka_2]
MTSSPPVEPTHFRGKTLSPASPRPLHISEPQNIPVLQNQIDPHFNLMSTHIVQASAPEAMLESDNTFRQYYPDSTMKDSRFTDTDVRNITNGADESIGRGLAGRDGHDYAMAIEVQTSEKQLGADILLNHMTQSENESSDAHGTYATFATPANKPPTPLSSDQAQNPSASIQTTTNTLDNPQDAFVTQSRNALSPGSGPGSFMLPPKPESDVNNEGVNYQALLDNLSPSSSTAPPADNIIPTFTTSPRTPVPLSPSSLQTPIATLPIPAGLPARPPPQEKPAIHPNYTPGEDIRSYHKPLAQNSNASASYNSQASNPQRPSQGFAQNNGVAPNGLPPPPIATFQQPMPNANQPQRSPQSQQFYQREDQGGIGGNLAPEPYRNDEQYNSGADIERSYERFLQDEATYVSEGTWDRFPQGSRLFVVTSDALSEMNIAQHGRRPQEAFVNETISETAGEARLVTIKVDQDHPMTEIANTGAVAQEQQRSSMTKRVYRSCEEIREITFVGYIQQSFRGRGLRCDVLQLPRVSLAAVVKRQIIEGVQAVVKIFQKSQNTGKIPLQVYNRSSGVENVRFDDYEDLDANIAAEIVFRAKSTHMAPAPAPAPAQYGPAPAYGQPQYPRQTQQYPQQPPPQQMPTQQQPQPGGSNTNLANLITSLDGPALQKLLGNIAQTPQTPQTPSYAHNPQYAPPPQQPAQPPHQDLASLLSSVARQQPQMQQQGYQYGAAPQPQQHNPYPSPAPSQGYTNNAPQYSNAAGRPTAQSLPLQYAHPSPATQQNAQGMPPQYSYRQPGPAPQQNGQGVLPQYSQPSSGGQQNVQDMLAQLAKYRP